MHTREQGYVPGYTARRICELLAGQPEMTLIDLAEATELSYSSIKGHVWELLDAGFISRSGRHRARFSRTTLECPPSSEVCPRRRREADGGETDIFAWWPSGDPVLSSCFRAMVMA